LTDHTLNIAQNLIICESNHLVPVLEKVVRSLGIFALSRLMRISINFYDQSQLTAEKVGIIGAYGHLSAEFSATDLPFGQVFPEFAFGGRCRIAQGFGAIGIS
jgi:hypothetical protein